MMRYGVSRRKRALLRCLFVLLAAFTFITRLMLTLRSLDVPPTTTANGAMLDLPAQLELLDLKRDAFLSSAETPIQAGPKTKNCATVDEMGKVFKGRILKDSLRVRKLIQTHFSINGNHISLLGSFAKNYCKFFPYFQALQESVNCLRSSFADMGL